MRLTRSKMFLLTAVLLSVMLGSPAYGLVHRVDDKRRYEPPVIRTFTDPGRAVIACVLARWGILFDCPPRLRWTTPQP
jgi:hypothetical protein